MSVRDIAALSVAFAAGYVVCLVVNLVYAWRRRRRADSGWHTYGIRVEADGETTYFRDGWRVR